MAVRVGDTLKPMNNQDFPVVDATDVSGLATVATTGSYNDLSDKPSIEPAGSESLPVYINEDSEPTPIKNLSFAGYKPESIWLHGNDVTVVINSTGIEIKDFPTPYDNVLYFYMQDNQTGDIILCNYMSGIWTISSATGIFENATVAGDYTDFTVSFDNTSITELIQLYLELGLNIAQYSNVAIDNAGVTVNGVEVSLSGHTHDYMSLNNKPSAGNIGLPVFAENGRFIPIDHARLTGSDYENYHNITSDQTVFGDNSITIDVSNFSPKIKQTDCIHINLYMSDPWGTFEFYCKYGAPWTEQYDGNVVSASIQLIYDANYEYVDQLVINYNYSQRAYTSFNDVSSASIAAGAAQYMELAANYISRYKDNSWTSVSWEGHTQSKSTISDWPVNVGSSSKPVYFNNTGTAQPIERISITGSIETTDTIRAENDFFTPYVTGAGSGEVWIALEDDDDNRTISINDGTDFKVNGPTVLGRADVSSDTVTVNNDIIIHGDTIVANLAEMQIHSVKPEIIFSFDDSYCSTESGGFPFYTNEDILTVNINPNATTTVMPNSSNGDKLTVNGNIITDGIQIGGTPAMGSSTGELVLAVKGWTCFEGPVSGKDPNVSGSNSSLYVAPERYTTVGQKTLGATSSTVGAYTTTSHTMFQCWGNAYIGKNGERHVLAVYGDVGAYNTSQTNTVTILGHGTSSGGNIYVRNSSGTSTVSMTGSTGTVSASTVSASTVSATTVSATSVNATNLSGILKSLYSDDVGGIYLIRLDRGSKPSGDVYLPKGSELRYEDGSWKLGVSVFTAAVFCYQQYGSSGMDFSGIAGVVNKAYKFYAITQMRMTSNYQYALGYFLRYV